MFKNIYLKSLYTMRWQLFGWFLAVFLVAFLTMVLYPSFSQDGIEGIVNSVPESLRSLVGNVNDFKTIPGYIGQQIFGPNLYIISLIMSILIFLGISAGEEEDGRLQSLLSFPVSRTKVYFHKLLAAVTVVAIISLSAVVGIWLALTIINESADYGRILESVLEFGLINITYGMIAFAVAGITGSKGLTILISSGYAVASLFITSLAPAVKELDIIDRFSLLHYYNNPQIMTSGITASDLIVILSVFAVLVVVGWLGFLRRDVKAS